MNFRHNARIDQIVATVAYSASTTLPLLAGSLITACLLVTDPAGAGKPVPRPNESNAAAPRVALSLGALTRTLDRLAANGHSAPKDLMLLGGISLPEAVVVEGNDVVLVGRRDETRPPLHLDDLVVLWRNVVARGRFPYCSLDPTQDSVLAVRRVQSTRFELRSPDDFNRYGQLLAEAWNTKGQSVVVGGHGVRPESRLGHVCIDADYHMKGHAQGRVQMAGVPSLMERTLAASRAGGGGAGGAAMARFWFRIAENQPRFLFDGNVIAIEAAEMAVFTEAQIATRDGRLMDAKNGTQDPLMAGFAADLSLALTRHPVQPRLYADLANQFRLLALLAAIDFKGSVRQAKLDLSFITHKQRELEAKPMRATLPGLVTYKVYETVERSARGELHSYQFPMTMGGVDMSMVVTEQSFRLDRSTSMQQLRQLVAGPRSGDRPVYVLLDPK